MHTTINGIFNYFHFFRLYLYQRGDIMKNLGNIIESRLQIMNMTQSQLGDQLGLNQRTISQYVRGKSMPSLETLAKMCNILDIDIAYILETEKNTNNDLILQGKDELALINCFRQLSERDQRTIISLATHLHKDSTK